MINQRKLCLLAALTLTACSAPAPSGSGSSGTTGADGSGGAAEATSGAGGANHGPGSGTGVSSGFGSGTSAATGSSAAAGGAGSGGSLPAAPHYRIDSNFNLDWKYQKGDAKGADARGFDDTSWGYVDLPHSTKFVTPDDPNASLGVSWYRKHFSVASEHSGKKVYLEFEGAMQQADVWVNGAHKIQHQGGYTPFTIDVTSDVAYGGSGDNVVAVKIDNNSDTSFPPGKNDIDFQFHGGIYRNVKLHVVSGLHVTDAVYANKTASGGVFVTYPSVTASSARVKIQTHVINEGAGSKSATVLSEILDHDGLVLGSAASTATLASGADSSFSQSVDIANPKLWSPDTPNLYVLRTTVQDGSTPVDDYLTRFGIRRVQWSHAGGLSINGARIKALGVNAHQESYGLGNAVPDGAIYQDVKRIKDGGMNFIRASHYPHAPAFYDACDELGILVLNPQTGWQNFVDTAAFKNASYQELRDMIRRDRNHPSIVAWEASLNETHFSDAWALAAHNIVHAEYPGDQAFSAAWAKSAADVFIGSSQADVRTSTDSRPIIISEYGDYDYGGGKSTSRQKREDGDKAMLTQAANVMDGTSQNDALSWYTAAGYWDYADYAGFSTYGITRCGLVDMYRIPKLAYYFIQSQRDPSKSQEGVDSGPMVHIANQWTPSSPTTVRVYGNCDEVKLWLDGAVIGTNSPIVGTHLEHPPFDFMVGSFKAGTLQAQCLIGGAVAATHTQRTPGAATAIVLRPEATTLKADQSDARLVFIDIVDANGSLVPTSNIQVKLAVSGPGSIVGPGAVTMKGGQLATWVRSKRTAGAIDVTATSSGLAAGKVTLTSEAVPGLPPPPADRVN